MNLERILQQQVHPVGMVRGVVEVGVPAAQVFGSYLHVGSHVPEYVGNEVLSVAIGTWHVVGVALLGVEAGHTVCAGQEYLGTDVILQACIPPQHGQRLHLAFLFGIGHDVYVQVAEVVQVLPDALSVVCLAKELPLLADVEGGGSLYAVAGDTGCLIALGAGVRHAADDASHTEMAAAVPTVLRIGGEVRHALLGDGQRTVGGAVYYRGFDGGVEAEVLQAFVGVRQLRGTVEGGAVRPLEVDGGG